MAMIKISCPKCQSKLKLKDDSKLGKKVRCPKCTEPFIAKAVERPKAPAQQVQDLGGFDDLDGTDDGFGAQPAPRSASRSERSPAKPAAKSSGDNNKVIALAIVGVLVLAGGGYGLFAMFGGGGDDDQPIVAQNQGQNQTPAQDQNQTPNENQGQNQPSPSAQDDPASTASTGIDLTYLPPDSEVFVHARVGEIWNSPFVQELIQGPDLAGQIEELRDAIGLEMGDFATATVGIPGALESAIQAAAAGPLGAAAAGKQAEQEFVIVVRLNKDVTAESLGMVERHNCQPAEHAGQAYFIAPVDDEGTVPGIYLPDSRTVVAASVEALKKVIDRGKTGPTGTPLKFVNDKQQLIVAVVPQDREALLAQAPPDDAVPPNVAALQASLKEHLHGVALGLSINGGIDVQVALGCDDASGAEKVLAQLQPLLDQGKAMFEAGKGEMNPLVVGIVAPIVEGAKLGSDASSASVTVSASVPQQTLAQLPMMYGMMMMSWMADEGGLPITPVNVTGTEKLSGQPAVDVAGVPEGLELEVLARWATDAPTDNENKKLPFPLELLVILKGEPAAKAYAYGNFKLGTATAEGGAALKQYVSEFAFESPETQLVVLDRDGMGFADSQPTDAVHAAFAFVQPTERVESVAVFEGTVQLQLPEESLSGTLTGVSSLDVSDAPLKKAGLTLKKVKEFGQENLQLSIPAPAILVQVEVQQANGEPYDDAYVVTQTTSEGTTMSVDAGDKPLPEDVKLEVTVHTKLKVLEVPFKFEKVSVPPTKQLTAEGIAEELLAEFAKDDKDDKAALTKYSNVTLSVTGTVEDIDKSADDDFRIQLKGRNDEEQISFHFSEKSDTLPKKGDKVTLRGTFTSYFFGTMSLMEGEIVSEK